MPDQKFPIPEIPKTFGIEQPIIEPLPKFIEPVWIPQPVVFDKFIPKSTKVATVKIKHPSEPFWALINAADFNPHQHEIYQEPATDPVKVEPTNHD